MTMSATRRRGDVQCTLLPVVADILAAFPGDDDLLYVALESVKIRLTFDDDSKNAYMPVLHYICGDVILDNEAYFINNGLWFKANTGFIAKVNGELDQVLYLSQAELSLMDWRPGEDEEHYNKRHSNNGMVILDRHLVRIAQEKGPIEFCDLLRTDGDGDVHLIHVKHACGAELRALFAQGCVSAQLYSESDDFRGKVHRGDVDRHTDLTPEDTAALANLAERPKRDFQVVYAIYDDHGSHGIRDSHPKAISEALDGTLTLFAKIDLLSRVQAIRSLGYSVALTRIEPHPSADHH